MPYRCAIDRNYYICQARLDFGKWHFYDVTSIIFRVQNHSLEEQLNVSRSNEQRTMTELGILRQTQFNTERVALTLQEVENVLKRVDAEKQSSMISQLQSACLERDNLKSLVDNLNRQNMQLTNNLKVISKKNVVEPFD